MGSQSTNSTEFSQQSRQEALRQLQTASQKLSQTNDPSEQQHWAQQVRLFADQVSNTQTNRKTAIMIDATVQSPEVYQQLVSELQSESGMKEISYHREGNSAPKVRIQVTQEALPQIQNILETVGRTVQQAYSGSSSSSSSR